MDIERLFEAADFSKETDLKVSLAERLGIEPGDFSEEQSYGEDQSRYSSGCSRHQRNNNRDTF